MSIMPGTSLCHRQTHWLTGNDSYGLLVLERGRQKRLGQCMTEQAAISARRFRFSLSRFAAVLGAGFIAATLGPDFLWTGFNFAFLRHGAYGLTPWSIAPIFVVSAFRKYPEMSAIVLLLGLTFSLLFAATTTTTTTTRRLAYFIIAFGLFWHLAILGVRNYTEIWGTFPLPPPVWKEQDCHRGREESYLSPPRTDPD
jgi:hypothetical protein